MNKNGALLLFDVMVETCFACLRVYTSARGYCTPVSIPVHTSYINAYFWNKLVLS
jgi:hypothetical protein